MLDASARSDQAEIENCLVSFLTQRLRALFDTSLHADAQFTPGGDAENLRDLFEASNLGLRLLQVGLKGLTELWIV